MGFSYNISRLYKCWGVKATVWHLSPAPLRLCLHGSHIVGDLIKSVIRTIHMWSFEMAWPRCCFFKHYAHVDHLTETFNVTATWNQSKRSRFLVEHTEKELLRESSSLLIFCKQIKMVF